MNVNLENISDTIKSPFEQTVELWKDNGYECLGLIGKGTFGHVYEVKNEEYESSVAMKICLDRKVSVGEKIIWPSMNNKYIVPLIASSHFHSIGTWVFFMPKYKTNLGRRIQELEFYNDINAYNRGKSYLTDVIYGLSYMHSHGICHGDLKIDNILIDNNDNAAIADFGYSQKPLLYIERYGLPAVYSPPEATRRREGSSLVDGFHLDEYALGMVILEMFTNFSLLRWARRLFNDIDSYDWATHIYPILFHFLQFPHFRMLISVPFCRSNVSDSTISNVLDVIKSLIHIDSTKRTRVFDLFNYRLFGGAKEYIDDVDDIWRNKADHRELKMKINTVAPNPLLSIDDVIEARKERPAATKPSGMSLSQSPSSSKSSNLESETPKRGRENIIHEGPTNLRTGSAANNNSDFIITSKCLLDHKIMKLPYDEQLAIGSERKLIGLERTCFAVFTSQRDSHGNENRSSMFCTRSRTFVPSLIFKKIRLIF